MVEIIHDPAGEEGELSSPMKNVTVGRVEVLVVVFHPESARRNRHTPV